MMFCVFFNYIFTAVRVQCIVIKCIKWFLANGQLRCVHSAVCRPVQCDKSSNIIHHHQLRPAPRDFADQDSLQTFHITSSTSSSSPISRHASVSSTYHGQSVRPSVIRKSVSPYCPSYFQISILSASLRQPRDDIVVADMEADMAADMEVIEFFGKIMN